MKNVIDFQSEIRRRDLSNSQPLQLNWSFVFGWFSALLLFGAVARVVVLLWQGWAPWQSWIENAVWFWQAIAYYAGEDVRTGLVALLVACAFCSLLWFRDWTSNR